MPNESYTYLNISIIMLSGTLFMFISNFLIQLLYLNYKLEPKLMANGLSYVVTFALMVSISWVAILMIYPEFSNLDILSQFIRIGDLFALFSVYILPSPVLFWIITTILYNITLIFFIKLFYVKKTNLKKRG